MKHLLFALALVACSKSSSPEPATGPNITCKAALEASAADPAAPNVVFGIKQCELENWSQPLRACIQGAPKGADLEATCFSKWPRHAKK